MQARARRGVSAGRFLVAAFGDPGHAFPAIALARALAARGNEVLVETWEHWREAVEGVGLGFTAAEEYKAFPPPPPGSDVCSNGLDDEGVSGLVDGDDPNCQSPP